MASLLDGKALAQKLKSELRIEVEKLKRETGRQPQLINLLIGEDAGSCAYASAQERAAKEIGIGYELKKLPLDISQEKLTKIIKDLNADSSVNGIMLHKPVPAQIDYHSIANHVGVDKDLEGINIVNIGKMILGETKIIPCTPAAVMEHIKSTGIDLNGKEAVVVGHSAIVGKPLSLLLLQQNATVTVCHLATTQAGKLEGHVRRADILIVAVGKASLVNGDWIKPGAVVIDVGINRIDGKIVGDVEFDKAKDKASFITPVPGGVGPVTVVMLMRNGLEAFKAQISSKDKVRL